MIGKYVIVRTYSAGVHAGILSDRNGKEVRLLNSRRIWQWVGAATLSELAMHGVAYPGECKVPCSLPEILLTEAIEIIPTTEKAEQSIKAIPVWEEHE